MEAVLGQLLIKTLDIRCHLREHNCDKGEIVSMNNGHSGNYCKCKLQKIGNGWIVNFEPTGETFCNWGCEDCDREEYDEEE
jgi:hypothetical protein